jgi:hypothetical protein
VNAPRNNARFATLLVPLGVMLALAGVASYAVDWVEVLVAHPRAAATLRRAVRYFLDAAWYVAVGVPVVIVAGSLYRLVQARGARGLVFLKLTAYLILWAAGTFVLFFALFAAYFMGNPHARVDLLVPAMLGVTGYTLIGLGLVRSVLRGSP